jgi:hypothetical protein
MFKNSHNLAFDEISEKSNEPNVFQALKIKKKDEGDKKKNIT